MYGLLLKFVISLLIISIFIVKNVSPLALGSRNDDDEVIVNEDGLYNISDNVVILNVTNIKNIIYQSKTAWFVQFYNSWCGYCQNFAPIWKNVASSIAGWQDIVQLAVIDCANLNNSDTCREYKVMYYPKILYFSRNSKPDSYGVEVEKQFKEDGVIGNIVTQLQKDQQDGNGETWPNISPYRNSELDDVWKGIPSNIRYKFFIFEDNDSLMGAEVILDLHNVSEVIIRRIKKDNDFLVTAYKVTKFPMVLVFDREGTQTKLKIPVSSREGIAQVIKDFLESKGIKVNMKIISSLPSESSPRKHPEPSKATKDYLYQADLESALSYSLGHEVAMVPTIEDFKLSALKDYLQVLSLYFPLKRGNAKYLTELYEAVKDKTKMSGKEFGNLVKSLEERMAPVYSEHRKWIGCKGSSNQFRGYPCGLWTMFHTLTVNYAIEDEESPRDIPEKILSVIYNYVKHFFGCSDCAEHFVAMADDLKLFDVETTDDAVLWLWRAHNKVNAKLAGNRTEDPEHPKIQYPSEEHCPDCRNDDDSWSETDVLNYLKKKYGYPGIHYKGLQSDKKINVDYRDLSLGRNSTDLKTTGWDFTLFDISICVVLYIISTVILALVCIKFVVKRSSKRKSLHNLIGKV